MSKHVFTIDHAIRSPDPFLGLCMKPIPRLHSSFLEYRMIILFLLSGLIYPNKRLVPKIGTILWVMGGKGGLCQFYCVSRLWSLGLDRSLQFILLFGQRHPVGCSGENKSLFPIRVSQINVQKYRHVSEAETQVRLNASSCRVYRLLYTYMASSSLSDTENQSGIYLFHCAAALAPLGYCTCNRQSKRVAVGMCGLKTRAAADRTTPSSGYQPITSIFTRPSNSFYQRSSERSTRVDGYGLLSVSVMLQKKN